LATSFVLSMSQPSVALPRQSAKPTLQVDAQLLPAHVAVAFTGAARRASFSQRLRGWRSISPKPRRSQSGTCAGRRGRAPDPRTLSAVTSLEDVAGFGAAPDEAWEDFETFVRMSLGSSASHPPREAKKKRTSPGLL